MFFDDNSDKESENEIINENRVKIKSVDLKEELVDQSPPLILRPTQSLTKALKDLKLSNEKSGKFKRVCPCGCSLRPVKVGAFRTREEKTLALHVMSPEILNHQGRIHPPNEIAPLWKKDCRKFLWKGEMKNKEI